MKLFHRQSIKYLGFLTLIISVACNQNTEIPKGKYAEGVIIINEGNFSESDGSIGFFDPAANTMTQDIYGLENNLQTSGVFQSVYFNNDNGFIIDQIGSRILVVEAESFKQVTAIESGLSTPRYMVMANNKGYVSNWGNFNDNFDLPESYVAVINLETFEILSTIPVGNGAEGMTVFGNNVYLANSYSNTIQAIDTEKDEVVSTINVADGPLQMMEDADGKHWLLSSSYISGSKLSQLDLASEVVLKSFEITASSKSLNLNGNGTVLYYLSAPYGSDGEVYSMNISDTEGPTEPLIVEPNLYGLGVDPANGELYLANHSAFQGNGTIIRYSKEGILIDNFAAGRVPNGFVFR